MQDLDYLQIKLAQTQEYLAEAETELTEQRSEISAFEFKLDVRIGHLMEKLDSVEGEINYYNDRIQLIQTRQIFGRAYTTAPPKTEAPLPLSNPTLPQPVPPSGKTSIKQLYRRLARRFHPDLAKNEMDRAYRTEKMVAINNAYAMLSLTALVALAAEPAHFNGQAKSGQTEAQISRALRTEIIRCQRRIREIKKEMRNLHQRRSVKINTKVKEASHKGRDLLAEMEVDLEKKISRKITERDRLKAQFNLLKSKNGVIS